MNFKKIFILSFTFVIMSGFLGCQIDEFDNISDGIEGEDNATISNPYDFVGEKHNEWLAYSMKNVEDMEQYYSEVVPKITEDLKLNEELNVDEIILKEELKRLKKITAKINAKQVNELYIEIIDSLFQSNTISEELKLNCLELNNIINSDSLSYEEKILIIENTETEILNNNNFSENEKEIFLSISATAKYSILYWSDYNFKNPWWYIVVGDVTGALVGSLVGPGGAVMLGITLSVFMAFQVFS